MTDNDDHERLTVGEYISRAVSGLMHAVLGLGLGATLLFAGFVFLFEALGWAKTGTWTYVRLADAFRYLQVDLTPVYQPSDWIGVASVAAFILALPLWLVVPMLGFFIYFWLLDLFGSD